MHRFFGKCVVELVIRPFWSRVIVLCHELKWLRDAELYYAKYLGLLSSLRFQNHSYGFGMYLITKIDK